MRSHIDLEGATFLVTGGARGLGYAVAELARQCGADVALCDLNQNAVNSACESLGAGVLGITTNVADETQCEEAVAQTVARFGKINVLVNNAGVFEEARGTARQDLAQWRRVIDVNLQGAFLMARASVRAMKRDDSRNAIVNFSSVNGLSGFRASNAYGVSKAAVAMLTQNLATDLAPRGVRVNAVAPGFIHTSMTDTIFNDMGVDRATYTRRIPMGRFGDPADVARLVIFLSSSWASYITGTIIPIDGGWLAFGGAGDAS